MESAFELRKFILFSILLEIAHSNHHNNRSNNSDDDDDDGEKTFWE